MSNIFELSNIFKESNIQNIPTSVEEHYMESAISNLVSFNNSIHESTKILLSTLNEADSKEKENTIFSEYFEDIISKINDIIKNINESTSRFIINIDNIVDANRGILDNPAILTDCNDFSFTKYTYKNINDSKFPKMDPVSNYKNEFDIIGQMLQDLGPTATNQAKLKVIATVYNNLSNKIKNDWVDGCIRDILGREVPDGSDFATELFLNFRDKDPVDIVVDKGMLYKIKISMEDYRTLVQSVSETSDKLIADLQYIVNDFCMMINGNKNGKVVINTKTDGIRDTSYKIDDYTSNQLNIFLKTKIDQIIRMCNLYYIALSIKLDSTVDYFNQCKEIISMAAMNTDTQTSDSTNASDETNTDEIENDYDTSEENTNDNDIEIKDNNEDIKITPNDDEDSTEESEDIKEAVSGMMIGRITQIQEFGMLNFFKKGFGGYKTVAKNQQCLRKLDTLQKKYNVESGKCCYEETKKAMMEYVRTATEVSELTLFTKCIDKCVNDLNIVADNLKSVESGHPGKDVNVSQMQKMLDNGFTSKNTKEHARWVDTTFRKTLEKKYSELEKKESKSSVKEQCQQVNDMIRSFNYRIFELNEAYENFKLYESDQESVNEALDGVKSVWKKIIDSLVEVFNKFKNNTQELIVGKKVDFIKENKAIIEKNPIPEHKNSDGSPVAPKINFNNLNQITIPDIVNNPQKMKDLYESADTFISKDTTLSKFKPDKDQNLADSIKKFVLDYDNGYKDTAQMESVKKEYYDFIVEGISKCMDETTSMTKTIENAEKIVSNLTKSNTNESALLGEAAEYFHEMDIKEDPKQKEEEKKDKGPDIDKLAQVYFSVCSKVLSARMSTIMTVFNECYSLLSWHIKKNKKNESDKKDNDKEEKSNSSDNNKSSSSGFNN